MTSTRRGRLTVSLAAALLALSAPIAAIDKQTVGTIQLTIGWGDESAFAGSKNSIDVGVADASGAPVADPMTTLSVEVSFGERHLRLPLTAVDRQPGLYRAWIVPSRAGSYAFHISGRVKGETIDITSACAEKTFRCVTEPGEVQFPEKDPSNAQLVETISRSQERVQRAIDDATEARLISFVAMAISGAAVGAAVLIRSLRSRRGRSSDRLAVK
jgi:hypothetical protein